MIKTSQVTLLTLLAPVVMLRYCNFAIHVFLLFTMNWPRRHFVKNINNYYIPRIFNSNNLFC